jgi:hypothetical protein
VFYTLMFVDVSYRALPCLCICVFVQSHGARGIFGLARKFKIIDDDNSKSISFDEFCKAIDEAALTWSVEQKKWLFEHFDRDNNGSISFDEFLGTVRGVLNERRKQFVLMAYELLDAGNV